PPLGNPSAISYSTSSARSDLKEFTSPMAAYNFQMRAICDVSDIRTSLAKRRRLGSTPPVSHVVPQARVFDPTHWIPLVEKVGVTSRTEAVKVASRRGLVRMQ